MPYKLSLSSINLMEECLRCFWLEKRKVWKRPSGPMSSLPAGMDRLLKAHFDRFMAKGELPLELKKEKAAQGCTLFTDTALLKKWRTNATGIQWMDPEGNIFHGAVDNLLVKGKKLIVLDYKTRGYPLKEDTAARYQLQLDSYTFLLRKNGYLTEDYGFLLFYIPKDILDSGAILFDTELVARQTHPKKAETLFQQALTLLNGPCPPRSCEWCEHA